MCQAEKTDIQPGGNGMEYQLVSFLIGGGASGTEKNNCPRSRSYKGESSTPI